ncbi:hypothetical protein [Marinobacter caseinilyticus]|uniref:hypothetical protein n=1 Tax=Marinobacter caseinilyticus TaxID=2692195 RepID=UPI00140D64C1|nr:hypothetical protein [Marinobacter caseinilyticus]
MKPCRPQLLSKTISQILSQSFSRLICGILTLSLTACATDSNLTAGVSDTCGSLQSIIRDYDTEFITLRGPGTHYRLMTLYRAETELIRGHCEVWSWAGGDRAYVCSANAPNEDIAQIRYQKSLNFVQQCLKEGWESDTLEQTRDGEYIGIATRFTSKAHPGMVVSVQNIVSPTAYRQLHSNYLFIGSTRRSPTHQQQAPQQ